MPVSSTLFHHAFEMLLKVELSNYLTYDDVVKLNHNLKKIWEKYKAIKNEREVAKFDPVVSDLDKWEYLRRYPKEPARSSTQVSFSAYTEDKANEIEPPFAVEETNKYKVNLEEMDEFFHYLITALSLNPAFILFIIGERDLEIYRSGNRHLLF